MSPVNEWTLAADVAKWIKELLGDRIDLPFSDAKVEKTGRGSRKRCDITLLDSRGKAAVTGELKMPYNPDGRSPFQDSLVDDAHQKADHLGIEYFFTWNVNRCVLWRTFEQGVPLADRHLQHWAVFAEPVRTQDDLDHPRVEEQIRKFLPGFLDRVAQIVSGAELLPTIPLDEKFLLVWESALEQPVAHTLRAIFQRYPSDPDFTRELDNWMRQEQGWLISHRGEGLLDNTERAAKFSCYILANKIVFYKALRRRIKSMRQLRVPDHVSTGAQLRDLLDGFFRHAVEVSRDYETVFKQDFGDTLPVLGDSAVESWRFLVRQTDTFDFTQIGYEVIGLVFERLLSTEERHKFGQHYTRSEVADLINAFCIRQPNATVLDPACGGGTFLVRAYARKRDLSGGLMSHQDLIRQTYGVDYSAYPAHLSTINLATRDLIDDANYPRVARADFFNLNPYEPIFHIPMGANGQQSAMLEVGKVDAVVGNPPYVRQERITEYYGRRYKDRLRAQARRDAPGSGLSGRSDIHCYFFTHSMPFLKEGAYLGLLTSSTWLDTTYGFRLQKFLLDNFEIVAVFESNCEPWFTGARVTTAVTILRREPDPEKRAKNLVRFALLTKPLSEMLAYSRTEDDRRMTFEALRDRVERMTGTEAFTVDINGSGPVTVGQESLDGVRVRIVRQDDLHRAGCGSVSITENDDNNEDEEADTADQQSRQDSPSAAGSDYVGFKWGVFLRAPAVFFKLLQRGGDRFVPLGSPNLATIKRGVTTGCDTFFFPQDVSDQPMLPEIEETGRGRRGPRAGETVRIVRAGDGSRHLVEAEYLRPVVFNLMEVDSAEIDPSRLKKRILLVDKPKNELRRKHVYRYIRWGEREGFEKRPTCRSRRLWYELPAADRGDVLWTMAQRYRHIVPLNTCDLPCNHNLFYVSCGSSELVHPLAAVLNSTVVALSKHQFGRTMGGDPLLKTEVVDVKMMPVPDPRRADDDLRGRLESALGSLRKRKIGHLVHVDGHGDEPSGELAMPDRQELDDAVLELIGVSDPEQRRQLRAELYAEVTTLYRAIRRSEKRMQSFRSQIARRGRPTPHSMAQEIWDSLGDKPQYRTILDFAPPNGADEIELPEGKAKPINDLWHPNSLSVAGRFIELGHPSRVRFVHALSDAGAYGRITIPLDPEACEQALDNYSRYLAEVDSRLSELASEYAADDDVQQKIVRELWRLMRRETDDI